MPFFFDLSSLLPTVERNPFEPVVVADEVETELGYAAEAATEAEPHVDRGLPIPASYQLDLMRALVQDPFHLFVHWQLKDDPFERLQRMFPAQAAESFQTVLKLVDESNAIAVFFDAAYAREYWFNVFPDRTYRVELGLRSPQFGFIKLLGSQSVRMPRGAPSDQIAEEVEYQIKADDYLQVLRESHLVPERAYTVEALLPASDGVQADGDHVHVWEALPDSFRQLITAMADVQAGREYERWWERLSEAELAEWVKEFLRTIAQMGDGELGYMLLLRYLPEVLRRAVNAELGKQSSGELEIDKPITLYLAERLGQVASEHNAGQAPNVTPQPIAPGSIVHGQWLPSLNL
ncbi:MAG: DUF4912 domain-containing protein [Acidobacteria bacterium]|nr:DUF4912 domain-containing protein [Acidobacteriota bacterium]MBI3425193.1 DUF4912 domain-containing protein [Acidobacteriota bacterium]